jgi:hypothetical protein
MHQLTIDHEARSVSVSEHPNYDAAHRALVDYVVGADYYLRPAQTKPALVSYQLLQLDDTETARPRPRVTGTATIAERPATVPAAPDRETSAPIGWAAGAS